MTKPYDEIRFRHMLDAPRKAMQISKGIIRADLDVDEVLHRPLFAGVFRKSLGTR